LGPLSDHRVSVIASGGDIQGAVAVRVAGAAEENTVLAVLWRKRPFALRAVSDHRQEVIPGNQLQLRNLLSELLGLRRKDTGGDEEAFHHLPSGDHADKFADVALLDIRTVRESSLL